MRVGRVILPVKRARAEWKRSITFQNQQIRLPRRLPHSLGRHRPEVGHRAPAISFDPDEATHRQLGLPPCTFADVTGVPCPSCGMTTSFALLVRGDVANSLRANWVGTLLATFCLLFIPWAAVSVVRGRALFVGSLERALVAVIMTLLTLLFLRWGLVLVGMWWNGHLRL